MLAWRRKLRQDWRYGSFSVLVVLSLTACPWAHAQAPVQIPRMIADGKADKALAILKDRLASNPSDAGAHSLMSRVYLAEEKWDNAVEEGEQAIRLAPDNSEYHLWLGRAYGGRAEHVSFLTAIGWARKVRREFQRAVELAPYDPVARVDFGEYMTEAPSFLGGGMDRAREQANALEGLDKSAAHWLRGRIAEKDSDRQEAEIQYRAAIVDSKNPAGRWIDLASFLRRENRLEAMQDAINKGVALDAEITWVYFDAASQLDRSGRNRPLAIHLLREYLVSNNKSEMEPAFAAHVLLGRLLAKDGLKAAAAEEYRAALADAKDFARARSALEQLQ